MTAVSPHKLFGSLGSMDGEDRQQDEWVQLTLDHLPDHLPDDVGRNDDQCWQQHAAQTRSQQQVKPDLHVTGRKHSGTD